jgi:hypothetical protein
MSQNTSDSLVKQTITKNNIDLKLNYDQLSIVSDEALCRNMLYLEALGPGWQVIIFKDNWQGFHPDMRLTILTGMI